MTTEKAQQLIEAAAAQLGEHFEAIQIIASFPHSTGGTQIVMSGRGNWYARQGMAKYFVEKDQAFEIALQIKNQNE